MSISDRDAERMAELDYMLTNQAPRSSEIIVLFETIRDAAKAYGATVIELAPDCRSRALALTYLEESVMRAIQSVALNQDILLKEFEEA